MKPLKEYPYRRKIDGLSGDDIIVSAPGRRQLEYFVSPTNNETLFFDYEQVFRTLKLKTKRRI